MSAVYGNENFSPTQPRLTQVVSRAPEPLAANVENPASSSPFGDLTNDELDGRSEGEVLAHLYATGKITCICPSLLEAESHEPLVNWPEAIATSTSAFTRKPTEKENQEQERLNREAQLKETRNQNRLRRDRLELGPRGTTPTASPRTAGVPPSYLGAATGGWSQSAAKEEEDPTPTDPFDGDISAMFAMLSFEAAAFHLFSKVKPEYDGTLEPSDITPFTTLRDVPEFLSEDECYGDVEGFVVEYGVADESDSGYGTSDDEDESSEDDTEVRQTRGKHRALDLRLPFELKCPRPSLERAVDVKCEIEDQKVRITLDVETKDSGLTRKVKAEEHDEGGHDEEEDTYYEDYEGEDADDEDSGEEDSGEDEDSDYDYVKNWDSGADSD